MEQTTEAVMSAHDPGSRNEDLDQRLAAAVERLGHGARLLLRSAASQHGLSIIQAQLLLQLAANTAGPATSITWLTEWFDVRQPTISDAVTSLERKGLLTKIRDGRRQRLTLTGTGRHVARELTRWDAPLRAAFAEQPGTDRDAALSVVLHAIASLQATGVISIVRSCTTCRFFRPSTNPTVDTPHHCNLLDAPLQPADLRLDCPEHQPSAG
jgi:DNA-binding MarR family transcriptional regulator